MISKDKLEKLYSYVYRAQSVAVVCHINPDGDAISSMLALGAALTKMGKTVAMFCDNSVPKKLQILRNFAKINTSDEKKFDLAIAVDCSDEGRLGISFKYFKHAKNTLTIDHHKTQSQFSDFTLCVPQAAATAEIMYEVLRFFEEKTRVTVIDDLIAEYLYAGMITDTGSFRFNNVTENTFRVAADIKKFKFDAAALTTALVYAKTPEVFRLMARVLSKAAFYMDGTVGVLTFKKEDFTATGTTSVDTEGIINELTVIDGVRVSIAITEEFERSFKVSVRSTPPIDSSKITATFGGGGHASAAGCRLNGYYEDVLEKLLKAVGDNL